MSMSRTWMMDAMKGVTLAASRHGIAELGAWTGTKCRVRLGRRPRLSTRGGVETMAEVPARKVLYMDGINWLESFWNIWENPWGALRSSDKKVAEFVEAARASNYEIVVVADADAVTAHALGKWYKRREDEICKERKKVSLGVDIFLVESFQKRGVRVVRPLGADADDVLAALAVATSGIVLSRDRDFFRYDAPLAVCSGFALREGRLILEPTTSSNAEPRLRPVSRRVQPELARAALAHHWSLGVVTKYRPSLTDGLTRRGSSSSSDKALGNLHVLARPLRAAVYAILGEQCAVEEVPEWSEETERVVWTATRVAADPTLVPLLDKPQSVVAWLLARDAQSQLDLDPRRAAERNFNICALAAELIVVSSQGAWTMRKCMELFHRQVHYFSPAPRHRRVRPPNPKPLLRPVAATQVYGHRRHGCKTDVSLQTRLVSTGQWIAPKTLPVYRPLAVGPFPGCGDSRLMHIKDNPQR